MRSLSRYLVLILALAVVMLTSAASSFAAPQLGAQSTITWGISRTEMDRELRMMREAGITSVRAELSWKGAEPDAQGRLNESWLREVDYAVMKAHAAGMHVLMPLTAGVPYWASADPERTTEGGRPRWDEHYRPRRLEDFAAFTAMAARRYGAQGVHDFEVWNEPNMRNFWASGPNPAAFAQLLSHASPAIRAADPQATIVMGGLSASDFRFLEGVYAAGGGRFFDVVAVHPYSGHLSPDTCWRGADGRRSKDAFCGLEEIRATMVRAGDAGKPVWATEFGWSTTSARWGVSEADQARNLVAALRRMGTYPWLQRAYVYAFRNVPWLDDAQGEWEANLGVVRTDFSVKPAFAALKAYAQGRAARPAARRARASFKAKPRRRGGARRVRQLRR